MANYIDIINVISRDHTGKDFHELLGSNSNTILNIVSKAFEKITSQVKPQVQIVEIPKVVEKVVEKIVYVEEKKKSPIASATKKNIKPKR